MDYTSLIASKGAPGSIANWINFSDALLPLSDVLYEAQALIYDSLRVRYMRTVATLAVVEGSATAELPAGLFDIVAVWDDDNAKLAAYDAVSLQTERGVDTATADYQVGKPSIYSLFGEKVQFDCIADAAYSYKIMAFCQPEFLSEAAPSNFLTTRWPTLLRTACLAIAADWTNDDARYQKFVARMQPLIQQANASDDRALLGMISPADYSRSRF